MSTETIVSAETPLRTDKTGTIRVAGTRITLDVLLKAYRTGHSAEDIVDMFPSLQIGDVYLVLGYYHRNQLEVNAYLARRAEAAAALRAEIEAAQPRTEIRQRLKGARAKAAG